ncbi:hypothetical protein FNU76_02730 [Chitinimonas arctica]|uniref:DUF1311 domain-containing protein n=1 Tax=Chitinimonas arctica TaxID=2594795 RepID=A0A516SB33_9NEIS|nr:hypothetical protein [Chitinimonas arctica]QDQ25354.1 hypothetical protein FNU76_02730 [Chitinimonas arctica]
MTKKWLEPITLAAMASLTLNVSAASFDCAGAKRSIDKLICADTVTSLLDERLAEVYLLADPDKQLKSEQLVWLKKRDTCRDTACLITQYKARIEELQSLSIFVPYAGASTTPTHKKRKQIFVPMQWDFLQERNEMYGGVTVYGSEDKMCQNLKSYLNEAAPEGTSVRGTSTLQNYCSSTILLAPIFSEPPWTELDPKEHKALIEKLLQYTRDGAEKYFQSAGLASSSQARSYAAEAEEFINSGGRVQYWKTRLLDNAYPPNDPATIALASGEQHVIQLRFNTNTPVVRSEYAPLENGCKTPGWYGRVFLVTGDLANPEKISGWNTTHASLKLFEKDPVLISDYGSGVDIKSSREKDIPHDCRLVVKSKYVGRKK